MSDKDRPQWDTIGTSYNAIKSLPIPLLERHIFRQVVQPYVTNAQVLDFACGTGYYSRLLLKWGANSVLGIDSSEAMIEGAKQGSQEAGVGMEGPREDWLSKGRLKFQVGNCSNPTRFNNESQQRSDNEQGQFDLVTGVWLLNYAASPSELKQFFETIALNLRSGGTFVGIVPNIFAEGLEFERHYGLIGGGDGEQETTIHTKYGVTVTVKNQMPDDHGWVVQWKGHTDPSPIVCEDYILSSKVYEEAWEQAGLVDAEWTRPRGPKADEDRDQWEEGLVRDGFERLLAREGPKFWDDYDETPMILALVLHKP